MRFIASYTDGRNIKRTRFPADSRNEAEATAKRRTPRGYKLFNLRLTKEQNANVKTA